MYVQNEIVIGFGNLPEFIPPFHTRGVDKHIDLAKLLRSVRHKAPPVRKCGDTRLDRNGLRPICAKTLDIFFRPRLVREITNRTSSALLHKTLGYPQSNPLIASSDSYDLALQAIGHFSSGYVRESGKG